jgi:hypothetical protein
MNKRNLVLKAMFAVALSSMASADSYNVTTSNGAGCTQTEDTGHRVETGAETNSENNSTTAFVKMTWTLGKNKLPKIDCNRMYNLEVARQSLELERQQLELQLLREQLATAKAQNKTITTNGDDW